MLSTPSCAVHSPDWGIFIDQETCSTYSAGSLSRRTQDIQVAFDLQSNQITLKPSPNNHSLNVNDLHLAIRRIQTQLPDINDKWQIFSQQGAVVMCVAELLSLPGTSQKNFTSVASQLKPRSTFAFVDRDTREKFWRFVGDWKKNRNRYSSGIDVFMHISYQSIIGMGQKVLPLIFEELSREIDHWFWALKAITQTDPVPREDVGDLIKMKNHWLRWATEQGYLWQPSSTSTQIDAGNSLR